MKHAILLLTILCAGCSTRPAAIAIITADDPIPGFDITLRMIQLPPAPGIKSIWMSQTEITWDAYDLWFNGMDLTDRQKASGDYDAAAYPTRPYVVPDEGFGHANYPAIKVHLHAAQAYCQWLSKKTGKNYRLPTEAEWEHACRTGQPSEPHELEKFAWTKENSPNPEGDLTTHPVATKQPNAWGLHDMLGNVAEWATANDGAVVKGGSYRDKAAAVTSRSRRHYEERWQQTDPALPKSIWLMRDAPHIGFRIVREN